MPSAQRMEITTLEQAVSLGRILAKSGYFKDAMDESKAVVKILAGQEVGIPPIAAMKGIHVIEGKPSFSAGTMAALVKRAGYRMKVLERSIHASRIEFWERYDGKWESVGVAAFTIEEARAAGLTNKQIWKSYTANMLFARAISTGVNMFCQEVFLGPVYTPEELGANVTEEGEVIDAELRTEVNTRPESPLQMVDTMTGEITDEETAKPMTKADAASALKTVLAFAGYLGPIKPFCKAFTPGVAPESWTATMFMQAVEADEERLQSAIAAIPPKSEPVEETPTEPRPIIRYGDEKPNSAVVSAAALYIAPTTPDPAAAEYKAKFADSEDDDPTEDLGEAGWAEGVAPQ
jgi:hypothetical protein